MSYIYRFILTFLLIFMPFLKEGNATIGNNAPILKDEVLRCRYEKSSSIKEDEVMKMFLGDSVFNKKNYYFHITTKTSVDDGKSEVNDTVDPTYNITGLQIQSEVEAEMIPDNDLFFTLKRAGFYNDGIQMYFDLGKPFAKTRYKDALLKIFIDPYDLSSIAALEPSHDNNVGLWYLKGKCKMKRI